MTKSSFSKPIACKISTFLWPLSENLSPSQTKRSLFIKSTPKRVAKLDDSFPTALEQTPDRLLDDSNTPDKRKRNVDSSPDLTIPNSPLLSGNLYQTLALAGSEVRQTLFVLIQKPKSFSLSPNIHLLKICNDSRSKMNADFA